MHRWGFLSLWLPVCLLQLSNNLSFPAFYFPMHPQLHLSSFVPMISALAISRRGTVWFHHFFTSVLCPRFHSKTLHSTNCSVSRAATRLPPLDCPRPFLSLVTLMVSQAGQDFFVFMKNPMFEFVRYFLNLSLSTEWWMFRWQQCLARLSESMKGPYYLHHVTANLTLIRDWCGDF